MIQIFKKSFLIAIILFFGLSLYLVDVSNTDASEIALTGKFTLDDGITPVAGVKLVFFTSDFSTIPYNVSGGTNTIRSIYTDINGEFSFGLSCGVRPYSYMRIGDHEDPFFDVTKNTKPMDIIFEGCTDSINLGTIRFRAPNVEAQVFESNGILTVGGAKVWVMPNDGSEFPHYEQVFTRVDGKFEFYADPGEYRVVVGYASEGSPTIYAERVITINDLGESNFSGAWITDNASVPVDEIFVPTDNPEVDIQSLINNIDTSKVNKDTIGLNVHWALGGIGYDDQYEQNLVDSGVKWVREHFQTITHPETNSAWQRRYNRSLNGYKNNNIHVVGMLAYGTDISDEFAQSDLDAWSEYVTALVNMYGSYVKVWEVWNEPDSSKYLQPNTIEHYAPILRVAYEAIKAADPDAIVLGGSFSWPYANYTEQLYQQAGDYFDHLAFHTYYCDLYYKSGNSHRHLQNELSKTKAVIDKYRSNEKVWITEAGCSSGSEQVTISQEQQKNYYAEMTSLLLNTGWVQNVFLYNFRDTSTNNWYEDNFGLMTAQFSKKPLWDWYVSLGLGSAAPTPVTTPSSTSPVESSGSFFAYGSNLRGGFNITAGNVMKGEQAEIIAGTRPGMGPHVRVFDSNGNVKAQFFAYDSALRNGVTVTACDVNGDGYKEIVTAQGRGGWPLVRIFDGYGNVINDGFFVLDGKFTGGVNVTCGDIHGDGISEIVVSAMHGGGPHVLVYTIDGTVLANFMAYDVNFRGGINVTTADADGDGADEIITGPQWGSPHVQIFQIRSNLIHRLSPGFYAFHRDYKGGVSVAGVDTDGDGTKELVIGVGDNATPLVKVYNIQEELLQNFYVFNHSFLGGVHLTGGDVDGDGADELMVIPRGNGGPQVRIINVDEV